jgi:uncharacterized membrane protein
MANAPILRDALIAIGVALAVTAACLLNMGFWKLLAAIAGQ